VQVTTTVTEVRNEVARARIAGRTVALVPTMGALHQGHLSLIRAAGAENAFVVVSVFVNPTQFNDPADLDAYPRDVEADAALAASAGADVVFAPSAAQMYPAGFSTAIHVTGVTDRWEGAERGASHFDGVALVVTKLFNIVGPDRAYFGQKDAQQVAVVRRFVADLNLPVEVATVPTVRAEDGLALSSRNARLSAPDREAGLAIARSLTEARSAVASGLHSVASLASAATAALQAAGVRTEYWAVVDPATFAPLSVVTPGEPALAIVAAWSGDVRLIDNLDLTEQP
jgi:pantoate--beta-alanine ligase